MPSSKRSLCHAWLGLLLVATSLLVSPAVATRRSLYSPGCFSSSSLESGTYNVTVNGTTRDFIVRVPPKFHQFKAHRVVFALHWYGGTMKDVDAATTTKYGNGTYYGLQAIAGAASILVAPQGLQNAWFNANGDDMAFMDALVAFIDQGLCVDVTQRFVVGFSFGGSMAYAIANARAQKFRAVAVLSGTDFTPWAADVKSLPVAFFASHGVSDPANPIAKGRLMRDHFVAINGCANETALEPAVGSASHIKTQYKHCTTGHPVTFIAFDGVHQYSPLDAGASTSWLPREIWDFFMSAPPPACEAQA